MTTKTHMIGICGAGMSAVARLLQERGDTVTGSDEGFYPPVSDYLTQLGLPVSVGHRAENIPEDADQIVIGKHAKLVPDTNAEVAAANGHGAAVKSFPEVLAELTHGRDRTVIAGSYGKSSLTSLIAWCLLHAGKAPGYFIGAIPKGFAHSSALGGGGPFIFEGDEYPSANWDDRAKFVHYDPDTVILTSATHDHVNIYPTLESYHAPFHTLLSGVADRGGVLIACTDETYASQFFTAFPGRKLSYGLSTGVNFGACNIVLGDPIGGTPTTFDLLVGYDVVPGLTTTQLGRHAVENACGAAAYLLGQDLLTPEEFTAGLASFEGLNRRLDRKVPDCPLPIFEGFGSSYEKARAAINAITAHLPARRLVVLFEPHTFTWRNKEALGQYTDAFHGAHTVMVYAPPDHGAASHHQASHEEILSHIRSHHHDARAVAAGAFSGVLDGLDPALDVVLILSSGSFGGELATLLAGAKTQFSST